MNEVAIAFEPDYASGHVKENMYRIKILTNEMKSPKIIGRVTHVKTKNCFMWKVDLTHNNKSFNDLLNTKSEAIVEAEKFIKENF